MKTRITALAAALLLSATAASASIYIRKGDQQVDVRVVDNALYCTRVSDKFEMCHGMTKQADGTWKGKKMKHPSMPGFMTFNGTVTFTNAGLNIRGCAIGICQSEDWTKQAK